MTSHLPWQATCHHLIFFSKNLLSVLLRNFFKNKNKPRPANAPGLEGPPVIILFIAVPQACWAKGLPICALFGPLLFSLKRVCMCAVILGSSLQCPRRVGL